MKISHRRLWARMGLLPILLAASWRTPVAQAAPDEIVVFTDEFEKAGAASFELHLNYADRARNTPAYAGEQPPYRITRLMPEVAWGIAEKWNLGVHVPFSYNHNTQDTTLDGLKLRLHYLDVTETQAQSAWFYGANFEIAAYNKRIFQSRYHVEVRGILGTRLGAWKFTLNPILKQALNHNAEGRALELDLFGQAMRTVSHGIALGVEHYAATGPVREPAFGSQSGQISYLVMNVRTSQHLDLQFGVGHGWNNNTDKLVYKALVGMPF